MEEKHILEFQQISKDFPGVKALDNVSFACRYGEVHALVGENGAGKSTLMKVLSGVHQPSSGRLIYKGEEVHLKNPHEAQSAGISIIFQEFSLIKNFDVTDNVFLYREPCSKIGQVKKKKARHKTLELFKEIGFELDVDKKVGELSIVEQQVVEIVKALSVTANIVIMDEPTAALTDKEVRKLFEIIGMLKSRGVTIIYISHMLEEVFEIADRVTVLKDGKAVGTKLIDETHKAELIRMMVGREIGDYFPEIPEARGEPLLSVKGLNADNKLQDINFDLYAGEVLGIAGMVGSGRNLLVKCMLGIERIQSGEFFLRGQPVSIHSIYDAIGSGFGYIPEDRKNDGILGPLSVRDNISVVNLPQYLHLGFLNKRGENRDVETQVDLLNIKVSGPDQAMMNLSGGNQQKVLISRWLLKDPDIYIFSEPTRGIDVGAKAEIYRIIREVTGKGKSVIMISSELPEIIGMSDRILVMRSGKIAGTLDQHEGTASEEEIMSYAVGHEYSIQRHSENAG